MKKIFVRMILQRKQTLIEHKNENQVKNLQKLGANLGYPSLTTVAILKFTHLSFVWERNKKKKRSSIEYMPLHLCKIVRIAAVKTDLQFKVCKNIICRLNIRHWITVTRDKNHGKETYWHPRLRLRGLVTMLQTVCHNLYTF